MFLPVNKTELEDKYNIDFVLISADAYVDHPTFGHAIISRLVESQGFSIGIIPQPQSDKDYYNLPIPRYAYLVSGGVVDSMVNNYTAFKKRRREDVYSPGNKGGMRPDRVVTVYSKALKKLFPDVPVIIGGIEASLRRFAHYDYWSDSVMQSIMVDSGADLLIYGMGEKPILDLMKAAEKGIPLDKIRNIRGTCFLATDKDCEKFTDAIILPSSNQVRQDKVSYAKAFREQSRNTDPLNAKILIQNQAKDKNLVQNLPALYISKEEMDLVYALPYERTYHPMYEAQGGIKALEEVKFSVTSHRGCFGSCAFCALNYHQGRRIQKRSEQSVLDECKLLTSQKDFKGYIHDIGGATANFRNPSCDLQEKQGICKDKYCIGYSPCKNLKVDHSEYTQLLKKARNIPGIKKVFIRSGIRYDYVVYDKNPEFFNELVEHHISGQLKVAPEHSSDKVLKIMNKPSFGVYEEFTKRYKAINNRFQKKQFLVPYLISSHPGADIKEAVQLTEYLKSINYMPEQVQDFYPTPSTRSTCIFYTGIDPDTMEQVYVARTSEDKKIQRALLQYRKPENRMLVSKAYKMAGVFAESSSQAKSFANKGKKTFSKNDRKPFKNKNRGKSSGRMNKKHDSR